MMPENIRRLDGITDLDHQERADLRDLLEQAVRPGPRLAARSAATTRPTSASAA